MQQKEKRWFIVLLVLIFMALAADLIMTIAIFSSVSCSPALTDYKISTRFVLDNPDCADKCLRALNITNVQIGNLNGSLDPKSKPSLNSKARF